MMPIVYKQVLTHTHMCVGSCRTHDALFLPLISDFTCISALFSCISFVPVIVVHVYVIIITVMKPYTLLETLPMEN